MRPCNRARLHSLRKIAAFGACNRAPLHSLLENAGFGLCNKGTASAGPTKLHISLRWALSHCSISRPTKAFFSNLFSRADRCPLNDRLFSPAALRRSQTPFSATDLTPLKFKCNDPQLTSANRDRRHSHSAAALLTSFCSRRNPQVCRSGKGTPPPTPTIYLFSETNLIKYKKIKYLTTIYVNTNVHIIKMARNSGYLPLFHSR
jgi:hypothetical protein